MIASTNLERQRHLLSSCRQPLSCMTVQLLRICCCLVDFIVEIERCAHVATGDLHFFFSSISRRLVTATPGMSFASRFHILRIPFRAGIIGGFL